MKEINKFTPQIDCPIFLEHKENIDSLTQSINEAKIISNELDKAQELLRIVDTLMSCGKHDKNKEDCESCRFILNLRKETALTIINANKLEA